MISRTKLSPYLYAGLKTSYQNAFKESRPINERMLDITESVCNYYKVKISDVVSSSRKAELAKARHTAMFLIKEKTHAPLVEIGMFFGGRDHSTVVNSRTTVNNMCFSDKGFAADLQKLRAIIQLM